MKKYGIVIQLFLFVWVREVSAQRLTPFVISSSGGFYSSTSGMLSFTTGEMSAVETFTAASAILTQGFQQYWDFSTDITEYHNQHVSFGIYPNPTDGYFDLLIETEGEHHVDVQILDVLGRVILHTEFDQHHAVSIQPFDLMHVAPGMYLITMTVMENYTNRESRFVSKIQVIK